jgi:predicted alpha-1,2-mannosidase
MRRTTWLVAACWVGGCSADTQRTRDGGTPMIAADSGSDVADSGSDVADSGSDVGGAGGAPEVVQWVDPLIGTDGTGQPWASYGGTILSVSPPFAMIQWTPATAVNDISIPPYYYPDTSIRGFMGTRQPAIWMGDYGNVLYMPGMGAVTPGAALPFSHANETALAYRYDVVLDAPQGPIKAAMTGTERTGYLRWTFPGGQTPHVVIEAIRSPRFEGEATVRPDTSEVISFNTDRQSAHLGPPLANFRGYAVARFDPPFTGFGTWDDGGVHAGQSDVRGRHVGAYVTFPPGTTTVTARVGTSLISEQQARANLTAELGARGFDDIADQGRTAWNDVLGRIRVEGGTASQLTIFYTALYHAMQYPRLLSEMGRYYSAADDQVHDGTAYADYSLWDTFRAAHPLLLFVVPERVDGMIAGLLHIYDEGGRLPMWPNPMETNIMIGTHADCVIADAFVKGFRGYDVPKAYQAVLFNATTPPVHDDVASWFDRMEWIGAPAPPRGDGYEARGGLTWYRSSGFIPNDRYSESVSRTVEYGVDDYCIAQMARELAPADVAFLDNQSQNYRNHYNPATSLLAPRDSHGGWSANPNSGFTEAGPWQFLFGAMHDLAGTIELLGGRDAAIAKIDTLFSDGHFDHTNEQGHHYSYLYDYVGQPWKTQERVRHVLENGYATGPGGLIGNEDCGQMSAWYVLSALGIYPVTPASGTYTIGTPLFPRVVLTLRPPLGQGTLTIEARNVSPTNLYIQSVELDGRPVTRPFLRHADLVSGTAKLVFEMGPQPNRSWGVEPP